MASEWLLFAATALVLMIACSNYRRPKKSGGDRGKFSKIGACLNLRNQASINSEPSCSGSVRSFGDAYSSEAIQPSLIYTSLYKSPLAGPTTIYIASFKSHRTSKSIPLWTQAPTKRQTAKQSSEAKSLRTGVAFAVCAPSIGRSARRATHSDRREAGV